MQRRHRPNHGRSKPWQKPWFVRRPEALAEVKQVLSAYPDLWLIETQQFVYVRGTFPVEYENAVLDRFQIEIFFTDQYPEQMPRAREIGGRIPWTLDSHVYPNTEGLACLQVPEEWLLHPNRSFRTFVDTSLRNYYLGQALVALGKEWPFGERSHGLEGLFQSYGEVLGESDPDKITRYLRCIASETIRGHWYCPCGSGRRVRHCCRQKLAELKERIPDRFAKSAIQRLRNAAQAANTPLPGADVVR